MSARELITEHLDLWTEAVTKKSSSGRGSNGKVELIGMKKLRELILQLAVMGRLVEQEAADTSPKLQLDTITRERTGLAEAGRIRPPSRRSTLSTQGTKPFSIPTSWYWTKLEDLFAVVTDGDHQAPPKSEKGIPFLVIGNLNAGQVNFLGCKHVEETYYEKLDWGRKPTSGDLLYTVTGSYGIPISVETERAFCVQRHVAILRATDSSPRDFVKLLLASTFGKAYADSIATGIAQKTVPLTGLRKMPVPLPPVQEQHRIVQKVDELMALCDRLEQQTSDQLEAHETLVNTLLGTLTQSENATELADNWARLAAHFDALFTTEQSIDKLKQTILQLAVMGRLVEQSAGDEPAEQLIERIAAQKAETGNRKRRAPKPPKNGTAESQPFQIPSTWAWVPLRQTGITSTGKTPSTKNASFFSGDIPFIGPGQVTASGKINTPEKHLSEEGTLQSEEALPGDILTVCIGGSIGKTAIVTERCGFNQQLNKIRPVLVEPSYLLAAINADFFQHSIREKATGSATPIINRSKWESIAIPLAPLAEQRRIVQKVDELMALCDQLKERLSQAGETRCQLAEAVAEGALN